MVETFTPAVCGSKRRQRIALAGFAAGAIGVSALVGALLGGLGALIGRELALLVAGLAVLAAARETGLLRVPLPQMRRQVPERWRVELSLPVWSVGYGAGLGAGFLTFQPVATFWVACAAAVALASPVAAAACFAAYGAARAFMAAWPGRGHPDPTEAVESLVRRRRFLLVGNVAALLVCAGLLAAAPSAGAAQTKGLGSGLDPSAANSVLSRARMDAGSSSVLVEPAGEAPVVVPGGAAPSVDGDLLAYEDSEGVKVIDWRTGALVQRIDGEISKPALDWPLLAVVRTDSAYRRLIIVDYTNPGAPTERQIARVALANDLGRPALAGGRVAWAKVGSGGSKVYIQVLATGRRSVVARSSIAVLANPSLTARRILWVVQYSRSCALQTRRLGSSSTKRIYRTRGTSKLLGTTALTGHTAYVTQWSLTTRASTLVRVIF
jgi:hypothetical protein